MEPRMMMEVAEIKRIYAAVAHFFTDSEKSCLLVTSVSRGEGKTTLTTGLAAIAARQSGKRVLAVDLNWYSPELHLKYGLKQVSDVSTLKTGAPIAELVQPSGIDRLDILTSPSRSNGNGTGTDGTQFAAEMLKAARDSYDIVLVDTSSIFPPNRYMIDPVALSKVADATLMVVLANVTARQEVKRGYMRIQSSGGKVAGVVVNQWKNELI